jgi:hypothetical protein
MKFLKGYKSFKESLQIDISLIEIDINESLGLFYDFIMKSIGAEEVNFDDVFKTSEFDKKMNLDLLSNNPDFIKLLSGLNKKKSNLTNSEDFETFLNKKCRFLLIHDINSIELENPEYIIFQSWNDTSSKWDDFRMFKLKGDIKTFYDKLSSRAIEIEDSGKKYIYQTSNGNEWELQNQLDTDQESEIWKKYFRKGEFENTLNDKKVKINII